MTTESDPNALKPYINRAIGSALMAHEAEEAFGIIMWARPPHRRSAAS